MTKQILFFLSMLITAFPLHSDAVRVMPMEAGVTTQAAQEKLFIFVEDIILCLRSVMDEPGCHKRERVQALHCCYYSQERLMEAQKTLQRWQSLSNIRAKRLVGRLKDSVDDMLTANELTLRVVKDKTKDPLADMEQARAKWCRAKERLYDISPTLIEVMNSSDDRGDFAPLTPRQKWQLTNYIDRLFRAEIEPFQEKVHAAERGDLADFTFNTSLGDILNIRTHLQKDF